MIDYEVRKFWCVSSSHVTEEDMQLFSGVCIAYPYEYGVFVPVMLDLFDEDCLRGYGLSEEFIQLIKIADSLDCDILRLDRDGPVYDNLPVFDWEAEERGIIIQELPREEEEESG